MDKEELRKARLRALTGSPSDPEVEPTKRRTTSSPQPTGPVGRPLDPHLFADLRKIIVGDSVTTDDLNRWYSQGFVFCDEPTWGLKQGHGGPCGILASVQAEIVKELCFARGESTCVQIPVCKPEDVISLLAAAIINILRRATPDDSSTIYLIEKTTGGLVSDQSTHNDYVVYETADVEEAKKVVIDNIESYQSGSGVIIFLMSLVLTRGISNIRSDMDDEYNSMVGQFGHSNQDLINLLLSGRATSNVFDGSMPMGDTGLMLKGIVRTNDVGYLTQLEALRYCQVGSYYKIPSLPIWVLGSSSHFTILFSLSKAVNEESREEKMLTEAQRAFKAVDIDDCGYIPVDKLKNVLVELNIPFAHDETSVARLRGYLQIDGGIIIWSMFWESISKLMSGVDLDELFVSGVESTVSGTTRPRSDSEYARELQAQFENEPPTVASDRSQTLNPTNIDFSSLLGASSINTASTPSIDEHPQTRPRSDSDIARELQKQYDEDISDLPALVPVDATFTEPNSPGVPSSSPHEVSSDMVVTDTERSALHRHDSIADESAEGLQLYHFNGLEAHGRPAKLTRFLLFKRSPNNAVGQSIALSGGEGIFANSHLEEILRTRWPGCRVDWLGQQAPSID